MKLPGAKAQDVGIDTKKRTGAALGTNTGPQGNPSACCHYCDDSIGCAQVGQERVAGGATGRLLWYSGTVPLNCAGLAPVGIGYGWAVMTKTATGWLPCRYDFDCYTAANSRIGGVDTPVDYIGDRLCHLPPRFPIVRNFSHERCDKNHTIGKGGNDGH